MHFTPRSPQDVIVQYAACLDERDFETYRECFEPEVELHGFGEVIRGVELWIEFVHRALDPFRATQHMLGPPRVEATEGRARLRTDLQAQHFYREPPGRILTLWGTYHTHVVCNEGIWRIRRHELTTRATRTLEA